MNDIPIKNNIIRLNKFVNKGLYKKIKNIESFQYCNIVIDHILNIETSDGEQHTILNVDPVEFDKIIKEKCEKY